MEKNNLSTVVVGMSGGVDSSVAALLLKQQGYRVIGLFMKCWDEGESSHCSAAQDYEDVVAVCDKIDIPHYSVNFVEEYQEHVFNHFLAECRAGRTPNPDILCNREIKFKFFYEKACSFGADFLATGHYCRIRDNHLLKGIDPNKDQSYFLYAIDRKVLSKILFPLGGMTKKQIRKIAEEADLPTSTKKDSTGICFIGKRNFKDFLSQYLPIEPGNIENLEGKVIGKHDGAVFYTIGQRKGLGIGGEGEPWFVVGKDIDRNVVIVEQSTTHPSLYSKSLIATDLTWLTDDRPTIFPYSCRAKIRYRQQSQECVIKSIDNGHANVFFPDPQRAITPGQSIVFYSGDLCLGGGIIKKSLGGSTSKESSSFVIG